MEIEDSLGGGSDISGSDGGASPASDTAAMAAALSPLEDGVDLDDEETAIGLDGDVAAVLGEALPHVSGSIPSRNNSSTSIERDHSSSAFNSNNNEHNHGDNIEEGSIPLHQTSSRFSNGRASATSRPPNSSNSTSSNSRAAATAAGTAAGTLIGHRRDGSQISNSEEDGSRSRSSSHATTGGSYEGSDDSGSESALRQRRQRARRRRNGSGGGGGSGSGNSNSNGNFGSSSTGGGRGGSNRRDRDRSRDGTESGRMQNSGGSSNSLSPRWDGGAAGGAGGGGGDPKLENSPRRRGGGGGEGGSPRELEPSKVLHVRNVGFPVVQSDLLTLLSCFGQVEKIKMFNGQALVQLPSVSIAKATMRHFEEDQDARIGNKKIYINYSRSRSIEGRDGDNLSVGNFNSNSSSNGGSGHVNGNSGLDVARAVNAARGMGGGGSGGGGGAADGNGQDTASPYAHLIMEDHAKLLGLATCYLQNYGIPGGEGAVLNISQREDMADYQRQAMAAAIGLNGGGNSHGMAGGWSGNMANMAATVNAANRLGVGMSGGGGGGGGGGYHRARSGSRGQSGDFSDRFQPRDRGGRGGGSQR